MTPRPRRSCTSDDEDTGLRCMRDAGHPPPHRVELEWTDDDEPVLPTTEGPA